jgi:hypothetical protein
MQTAAAGAAVGAGVAAEGRAAVVVRLPAWIQSPPYDLLLLLLVPLVPVPVLLLAPAYPAVVLVAGLVLGFSHYMSTFTFFAWDEYRERHRSRKAAFFGGPLLIVAMMILLARVPLVIPVVLFFWNVLHVARQSSGVSSVYRHRAGVGDPVDKQLANAAILSACVALSLSNVESHRQVLPVLTWLTPGGATLAKLATGAVALVCLVRLLARLQARARSGSAARMPELLSLGCALALFHPYLWVEDSGLATAGMLLGHFVQYLSLVWLVHHRRFTTVSGSAPQRALAYVSQRRGLVVGVLLVVGLASLGGYQLSYRLGLGGYFEAMYLTVAFVHFYLDGLFWAFRDPSVRRSLSPYLTGFRPGGSPA